MNTLAHLHSPRLTLRLLHRNDLPALCAYRSRPDVARYQSWTTFTPDDAAALLAAQSTLRPGLPNTWFQFAILLSTTNTLIGDCGLHTLHDPRQAELGITLSPDHQHQGYAAEALASLISFAFNTLHMHRLTALTDADNTPAASLFTRLGFRHEARHIENVHFKGRWTSEHAFALLRREWQPR